MGLFGASCLGSATAALCYSHQHTGCTVRPHFQSAHIDLSSGGCCHAHCTMSRTNCAKDMFEGLARQLLALIIARQHQI